MKIIDEKGRLFRRINVIDFLVILFLLCLAPMFYFGYKIFNKRQFVDQIKRQLAIDKQKEDENSVEEKERIIDRIDTLEKKVNILSNKTKIKIGLKYPEEGQNNSK